MNSVYIITANITRCYGDKFIKERRPVAVADSMETANKIVSNKKYAAPNVKYVIKKFNIMDSTYGMASL